MTNLHWILELLGWLLGAAAFATAVLWAIVWLGVEHSMRVVPTLRLGQRLAQANPPGGRVCVVAPAHDEQRVIGAFVRSLRNETYPHLKVVLVLDRCTDATASLARAGIAGDERFEIVEVDACPPDWAGKVHAVHAGVTRSRSARDAEFLLFTDVDTVFEPGCISAALALQRHRKVDLLSVLSTLTYDMWFERIVQTAASFELLRQYPLIRANGIKVRRAFANGQFMLFTRGAYEAVGGHAAVKAALLEDLALARLVIDQGRNSGVFLAAGLLHCRMYADWPRFRSGWKRIYTEAANRKPARLEFSALRIRFLGTLLPVWTFGCGAYGTALAFAGVGAGWSLLGLWAIGTFAWLGALLRVAAVARAPLWTAPLHVLGAWITGRLLNEAAEDLRARRPMQWGGRRYDVAADGEAATRPLPGRGGPAAGSSGSP